MPDSYLKDPSANKDYWVDWAPFLAGDTIQTSVWTVPTGLTKGVDSKTDTTTTVWLSGGTLGANYVVVNRVTTAAGRIEDKSLYFYIRDQ
jgi:hypothetical protein